MCAVTVVSRPSCSIFMPFVSLLYVIQFVFVVSLVSHVDRRAMRKACVVIALRQQNPVVKDLFPGEQ